MIITVCKSEAVRHKAAPPLIENARGRSFDWSSELEVKVFQWHEDTYYDVKTGHDFLFVAVKLAFPFGDHEIQCGE
jgi:hypothetical protein